MPQENDDSRRLPSPFFDHFQLPAPVKRIFDIFPLKTYPPNGLPHRSPKRRTDILLHIFTTTEGAYNSAPSFNPACLKWQVRDTSSAREDRVTDCNKAYLTFCGVDFKTAASNNHASPTGVLPFLTPASDSPPSPIPANKILKWVNLRTGIADFSPGSRHEAYASLINHRIRSAWLITLYLDDRNSEAVAKHLYIYPTSSNPFVQMTLFQQLKKAAQDELLRSTRYAREDEVYVEAEKAFAALSILLNSDAYFFGEERPSLFDASVFAYTHLLLDESLNWQNKRLPDYLKSLKNLVQHRQRLLTSFFS
jgi:metaxin